MVKDVALADRGVCECQGESVCVCVCAFVRERELKSGECVRVSGRERGLDGRERERVLTGSKVKLQYESVCVCVR
jgi:hypothetical protein